MTSFFMRPKTENEVLMQLQNVNPSMSAGSTGFSIKFIETGSVYLAPILTKLFNISIQQCTFSDIQKIAEFVPIHSIRVAQKLNAVTTTGLYPSCTPFLNLKNACMITLYLYFSKNNLFYDYQSGLREKLSAELAVN